MFLFDEKQLLQKLEQLATNHRVAFAAACAQRQLPCYQRFSAKTGIGDFTALENMLESLWKDLNGNPILEKEIETKIDACMQLIPQEDLRQWENGQAYAENAAASLVYALRCRQTRKSEEAIWAAQRAYEALDNFVINTENIDTNIPGEELHVLSHPLIQAELGRQQRDLDELHRGVVTVQRLQERAKAEAADFLP